MMETDSEPKLPARRQGWIALAVLLLIAGMGFWIASNRVPADATAPLQWRDESATASSSGGTLRIGSFNIHSGEAAGQESVNLDKTAAVLERFDLDFVALYEVSAGFQGDQALTLGRKLEMASLFEGVEYRFWHEDFGNGLLSRVPVESVVRIDLPCTQPKKFRIALLSTVELDGTPVRILATHIDTEVDHDRQFVLIAGLFKALKPPAILMGDLNCTAEEPLLARLLSEPDIEAAITTGGQKAPSGRRVDHILVKGLRVETAQVVTNDASDHPLVWAEVSLEDNSQGNDGVVGNSESGR